MASSGYDESLTRLLAHEGGYTNHPSDPGGATNFGITIIDYRKYVKPGATAADVKAMRVDEAKRIYRAKYWDAMRCDELPAGVDYAVFDYGVNSGVGRARKVLQRVVGVKDDGMIGAATLAAISARDPKAIIPAVCNERLRFLKSLKTWGVFGKGWGRRVIEVKSAALAMASRSATVAAADKSPVPTIPLPDPARGKGSIPAPNPVNTSAPIGTGVAAGAFSFWGWIASHPAETIALVAALLAAGWMIFELLRHRRNDRQEAPTPGLVPVPPITTGV